MQSQLPGKDHLWKKFTPNYEFGCKRALVHSEYYPTFNLQHVHLHVGKIEEVRQDLIVSQNGEEHRIDVRKSVNQKTLR